jgi:RNA polymerase sigma factor (sigma-70 family)
MSKQCYDNQRLNDDAFRDLIQRAQQKDKAAFTQLFELFEPFRRKLASKYVNKGIDNDEICQQVDLAFCESVKVYNPMKDSNPVRHLVYRTAQTVRCNYAHQLRGRYDDTVVDDRTLRKLRVFPCGDVASLSQLSDNSNSLLFDNTDNVALAIDVKDAIDALSPLKRAIACMHYYDGMSQNEIADAIGRDQSVVSRHLADIKRFIIRYCE